MSKGLRITRRFTEAGKDAYDKIEWSRRDSRITNPDGSIVFEMTDAEIPAGWSQVAADIMVSKYFRKAGVPQFDADGNQIFDESGQPVLGPERSARQVFDRLAGTWRHWGEKEGYFASTEDAVAFEDELKYMLANQMAAPNSPQWFNTGLNWAYGLTGPAQGLWFVDGEDGELKASPDSYSRPAPHACYILSVRDDLVNPGGIMDLWVREARIFKFGSGAGSNFSQIRGENERLSGGGKSSGVMSFLKIGDRAAGAIKSGGTTRRAAKMVILDVDHPDIEKFIDWKKVEEEKARVLINHGGLPADFNGDAYATVSGQNSNNSVRVTNDFIQTVLDDGDWELKNRTDGSVRRTVKARDLWNQIAEAAWACADPGLQFDTTVNEWHTSPAGGRIRGSNPCFTGEMRVATDKGLIPFKSLVTRVAEGESFQVYTHDATNVDSPAETLDLTTPTQVMVTGTNQILRLEFSDGRVLRCTPNHRLWTSNKGWVRADELTETDQIRLLDREIDFGMASWAMPISTDVATYQQRNSSRKYAVNLPEKWSEDFAHYLGWLVGDGSMNAKTAVTVYGSNEEQRTTMLLHRELLTELNGGVAPKPAAMGNGTFQLRVTRNPIRSFLEALGVKPVKAGDKRVPWSIFEAPKPIVAAFLRGLYDADGCVHYGDTTRYVGLASASKDLLRDVQQLLDTFGVHGSIYSSKRKDASTFEYTTTSGEARSYRGRSEINDLRVMGSDLKRFFDSVGLGLSIKDDILHQVLTETTRYATRHWVRLKSRAEDGWETTYNLTEPKNHSYLTLGIITSNCSEYMFLDDTACNLASINLVRFHDDETGVFDIEGYQHAVRLWTIVLEISVAMAHFPSPEIAQGSFDYRTLGLGYANLGSLLMRQGIAYDSDKGRAIAGAMTAILTGHSYATSAEIAETTGPFPRFSENRESMLRVMRNHRRAAYGDTDYEGVSHKVMAIDSELCPEDLLAAARSSWDLALKRGEAHGYRNAQASVIAPTGTIGLLLDSDTTGIEPDFALVKFKKLAGGGYFKIANQSVAPALRHLGYDEGQIKDVVEYIVGTSSLDGAPHINRETLAAKGFTDEDLDKVEKALPAIFELRHAFNVFTFGEETLQRLGFGVDEYTGWEFNLLKALGFSSKEINEANDHICGRQTIEGAPHIRDEHLSVFDTANKNGKFGERFIHHYGHIKMMAAAQPFISGAISKTINMPHEITVEDIEESYRMSWEWGLKAMALYRDGSKAAQPLNSTSDEGEESEDEAPAITAAVEAEKAIHWGNLPAGISPTQAYRQGMKPPRFLLPARRAGYNQEARIGGHKVFLRTGEYEDGTLGEIFIDLAKEGATLKGILSCFAIAVSKGLQYGVPLEEFVDTFTFQTFEPRGMVEGHPNIKMANSIVDYVFRALGVEYLERDELAQVPPNRDGELPEPPNGLAIEAGVQLDLTDAVAETDVDALKHAAAFVDAPDSSPNGGIAVRVTEKVQIEEKVTVVAGSAALVDSALKENMGDAPVCSNCGHMTIRNGSCYVCLTCGDTTGCS
jgi:ribonucleoside-diphosphate reductase alpha chain